MTEPGKIPEIDAASLRDQGVTKFRPDGRKRLRAFKDD